MAEPRVIFVNRVYWPSGEATAQLLADLAEGLAGRGWDVHVITAGEASTVHRGVTIHRTGTPEQHGGLASRALSYRRFLRAVRRQLTGLVRAGDLVVALTDPPMLGAVVAEVATAQGARVVQWIQDIYPEIAAVHFGPLAGFLLGGLKRRRNRAWAQSTACVTLGADMAQAVATAGVPTGRISVRPNWAPHELDEPAPAAAVAAYRQRWNAGDRFVVIYAGNLGRVHEFATLLDTAEQLKPDGRITFRFVGHGPQWAQVVAAVQSRGLTNVELQPAVPRAELGALLAAADAHLVTLLPAYGRLVYPSKLAGVLAAGRPTLFVGPVDGDIARLLQEQACGASFAPGNTPELAATIQRWTADRPLAGRLGANARRAYARQFTLATAIEGWDALLRQAALPA